MPYFHFIDNPLIPFKTLILSSNVFCISAELWNQVRSIILCQIIDDYNIYTYNKIKVYGGVLSDFFLHYSVVLIVTPIHMEEQKLIALQITSG